MNGVLSIIEVRASEYAFIKTFIKLSRLIAVVCLVVFVTSCSTTPTTASKGRAESKPKNVDNICEIFSEKTKWIEPTKRSYNKWGIPVELMMAIIRHESSFRSQARPIDKNGKRLSSAYGYSQAIDGTWKIYQRENNKPKADRTQFSDAIDFVGWYSSKSIAKGQDISPFDVNALYVFYHDGWGALPEDGSRELKPEVLKVAAKIYKQTLLYHRQLKKCPRIASALYGQKAAAGGWGWDNGGSGGKSSASNRNNKGWF